MGTRLHCKCVLSHSVLAASQIMEGGNALFQGDFTIKTTIVGEVNGIAFEVQSEGKADGGGNGEIYQHAHCVSGSLPCSWQLVVHALSYGVTMFSKYPNGIVDFFKESFPEGYQADRVETYEGDGVVHTHLSYRMEAKCMHTTVTLEATGFREDGPLMTNRLGPFLPCVAYFVPHGNNTLKGKSDWAMPIKGTNEHQMVTLATTFTANGKGEVKMPKAHHLKIHNTSLKDAGDCRDHIIVREKNEAFDASLISSVLDI